MLSNKELVQYSFFILFLLKKEKLEVKNQEHFVSDIYLKKKRLWFIQHVASKPMDG